MTMNRKYSTFSIIFILILNIISCKNSNNIKQNNNKKSVKYYENTEESKHEKTATYYEIFVRSYADSNGDGIGDINGIINKLDTLEDFGVEGIWLTPIFKSPSYHKYDVTDYYNVDPEYGTNEDLKQLVEESHKRNIKVILDLPVNHTSKDHPWFKDIISNKDSKYKEYYRITKNDDKSINLNSFALDHKSWNKLNENESYYAIFWEGMPDLNFSNKNVRDEVKKIGKFWLNEVKIDGYRLDAAYHIYGKGEYSDTVNTQDENILWWSEFRTSMQEINKNVYIVGETWVDASQIAKYYNVFDSNFNFAISEKGLVDAISSNDAKNFADKLNGIYKQYESITKNYIDAPFLSNHDQNRIANTLITIEQQKLAASVLLTLPGNPFIYYGEELGMRGSKPDEEIREPYLWGDNTQTEWEEIRNNLDTQTYEKQKNNKDSLYNYYKKWLKIRKENEALKYGDFNLIETGNNKIMAFKRTYKSKSIIVVHNFSSSNEKVKIENKEIEVKKYESVIM